MDVVRKDYFSAENMRRYIIPLALIIITLLLLNWLLPMQLAPRVATEESAPLVDADAAVPADGIGLETIGSNFTNWLPIKGAWQARDGGVEHTTRTDFDNYIAYTTRFEPPFAFNATVQHLDGIGAGLLIGMQSLESNANSTLVRFETDGSAMFWGSFDEAGQFTGQGFAPIRIDTLAPQRVTIRNLGNSYDVILNGETVVTDLALTAGAGYVGLAAPETAVFFSDIRVSSLDGIAVSDPVAVELIEGVNVGNPVMVDNGVAVDDTAVVEEPPTLLDQVETISGEWIYEEGAIRQILQEPTDYVTGLNIFGRNYTLASTITLDPATPDSGGGFIFHAPDRDQLAGSTMVRLLNGGEQIVWGQFDETGVFQGAGNIELDLSIDESHDIAITVGNSNYDILVNGETIVRGLPLAVREGWIGLVAYRGVVTFEDVILDLDG